VHWARLAAVELIILREGILTAVTPSFHAAIGSSAKPTASGRGNTRKEELQMRIRLGLVTVLAASTTAGVMAAPAFAEERTCRGTIGATTVDNLRVPQGATCTLNGTRVKGTVKVERGATLKASRISVVGNVQAEGAANVNVATSAVGGSVQVVQGKSSKLDRNSVKGDVQYFENRGAISITRNRIDGNLQCKENSPSPTGGGNIVQGNKEDQCARL
jgi:hypothetical protein